jgi:hypothetical protein
MISVIFLGIVGYLGTILYKKALGEDLTAEEAGEAIVLNAYPGRIEIESLDGRVIEVTLLGRNQSYIQFLRDGDEQQFDYPMASLSPDSQTLVLSYPDVWINDQSTIIAEETTDSLEQIYVQNLKIEIGRIDENAELLRKRSGETQSKTDRRTIMRELQALRLQRAELTMKISERASF